VSGGPGARIGNRAEHGLAHRLDQAVDVGRLAQVGSECETTLPRGRRQRRAEAGIEVRRALTAMERISAATLPRGYRFEWTLTVLQEKAASGQTRIVLGLAVLFAYLFLVVLHESWNIPCRCRFRSASASSAPSWPQPPRQRRSICGQWVSGYIPE
jgi:hypothetical protein